MQRLSRYSPSSQRREKEKIALTRLEPSAIKGRVVRVKLWPGIHRVGLEAGLDGSGKSRPQRSSNPWLEPVASRYTDWAIAAT
jgi:hypothetical protein